MSGNPYDNGYYQRTDGIYDEYPSSCQSADYDYFIMGYDTRFK